MSYPVEDHRWADRQGHLWDVNSITTTIPTGRWECAVGFMDWYLDHGHPCVLPTTRPPPLPVVDHPTPPLTDPVARMAAMHVELQRLRGRGDGMTHQELTKLIDRYYDADR